MMMMAGLGREHTLASPDGLGGRMGLGRTSVEGADSPPALVRSPDTSLGSVGSGGSFSSAQEVPPLESLGGVGLLGEILREQLSRLLGGGTLPDPAPPPSVAKEPTPPEGG